MQQFACGTSAYDAFSAEGYQNRQGRRPFPFLDPASQAIPQNWREIYQWGRLVLMRSPEFMDAHRKLFSYFATDLEITSADADDQSMSTSDIKGWRSTIEDKLAYKLTLLELGVSVALFGSAVMTLQNRYYRQLVCPHPSCGRITDMLRGAESEGIDFKYQANKFTFRCPAPNCPNKGQRVAAIVKDWSRRNPEDMRLKIWPADEISIDHYLWSGRDEVYWKIPEHYKQAVRKGHLETLAEADLDVLEAIQKNTLFKFFSDRVFHAKELTIAGAQVRGRGIPRSLLLAPQIWHLQVLRHQNQVLSMDYLVPLGFFSLDENSRSGEYSGPASSVNPNQFAQDMRNMFAEHRRDPTQRFAVNYAVRYQIAGGEAAQLVPVPMIAAAKEDIYDGSGVPLEMYRGSLNIQVMPVAARLFESSQQAIPAMYNGAAAFVGRRVAEEMAKPRVEVKHSRSSVVSDMQRVQLLLQGRQIGDISKHTLYSSYNIDVDFERSRLLDEQLEDARAQKEFQEKLEDEQLVDMLKQVPPPPEQQGGEAGAPADPNMQQQSPVPGTMMPSQGLNVMGLTIDELSGEAERIATSLVDPSIPQSDVNRELRTVRSQSEELHSLVVAAMNRMRRQAAAQGQQAILSGQL